MNNDAPAEASLGPLDFVYAPSADVAADVRWFTDVLGATVGFAIDAEGTRVASVHLGGDAPALVLTDHLPDDRPVLLYRVEDLAAASKRLRERGWTASRTLELPPGPCSTFEAPGGLRLAIYERSRPFVVDSFAGRHDF